MVKKVTVYTTRYCPYCKRAKALLESKGVLFEEVDLTEDDQKRSELEEKTGWQTVPMIFIGDQFIGGSDDLFRLDSHGKLDSMLSAS
jgi:glutaredoxin 3